MIRNVGCASLKCRFRIKVASDANHSVSLGVKLVRAMESDAPRRPRYDDGIHGLRLRGTQAADVIRERTDGSIHATFCGHCAVAGPVKLDVKLLFGEFLKCDQQFD